MFTVKHATLSLNEKWLLNGSIDTSWQPIQVREGITYIPVVDIHRYIIVYLKNLQTSAKLQSRYYAEINQLIDAIENTADKTAQAISTIISTQSLISSCAKDVRKKILTEIQNYKVIDCLNQFLQDTESEHPYYLCQKFFDSLEQNVYQFVDAKILIQMPLLIIHYMSAHTKLLSALSHLNYVFSKSTEIEYYKERLNTLKDHENFATSINVGLVDQKVEELVWELLKTCRPMKLYNLYFLSIVKKIAFTEAQINLPHSSVIGQIQEFHIDNAYSKYVDSMLQFNKLIQHAKQYIQTSDDTKIKNKNIELIQSAKILCFILYYVFIKRLQNEIRSVETNIDKLSSPVYLININQRLREAANKVARHAREVHQQSKTQRPLKENRIQSLIAAAQREVRRIVAEQLDVNRTISRSVRF